MDGGRRDQGQEQGQNHGDHIQTKWGPYMRTLPTIFDTPMFWSTEELEELQGTAVVSRSIDSELIEDGT